MEEVKMNRQAALLEWCEKRGLVLSEVEAARTKHPLPPRKRNARGQPRDAKGRFRTIKEADLLDFDMMDSRIGR